MTSSIYRVVSKGSSMGLYPMDVRAALCQQDPVLTRDYVVKLLVAWLKMEPYTYPTVLAMESTRRHKELYGEMMADLTYVKINHHRR